MPKVSIIMPTYNVEKYFRQCIESVINQTLKDIEIIPVDDGSPDNCGKIMDEYAIKDSRIKPIHKPNGGYGTAVNVGIEKATGEYIAILETDDWVEPNTYELLYDNAKKNNTDITKCGFYYYNSYNIIQNMKYTEYNNNLFVNIINNAPSNTFNILEYPELLFFHASVWAAVYKKEFIKDIKFIEKEYYQDFPFAMEALCKAKSISIVKEYLIHYRMEDGQNSSTSQKNEKLLHMAINTIRGKEIIKKYQLYDKLKEQFYFHAILANIGFYKNIQLKYKKKYLLLLKDIFKELDNDKNFKYTYFSKDQKKLVKDILNKPIYCIMLKWYFKYIKSFFIYKYDYKKYNVIVLFKFIKITRKSNLLELNNRINNLEYLILELNDKLNKNNKETK